MRFQARVSSALPWKVIVSDALGRQLDEGTGQGPTVDWTLGRLARRRLAGVRWRIEVAGATPVTGTLGKTRRHRALSRSPACRRPGDDQPERRRRRGQLHDHLHDERRRDGDGDAPRRAGAQLAELGAAGARRGREHTLTFDGLGQPDGVYTIVLTAVDATGISVTSSCRSTITRTLGRARARARCVHAERRRQARTRSP